MPKNTDLYITSSSKKILNDFRFCGSGGNIKKILVENKGRDIYPLCKIVDMYDFKKYSVVLKLHSKKSFQNKGMEYYSGDEWRERIFRKIGSSKSIKQILNIFENQPDIGILGCREDARSALIKNINDVNYNKLNSILGLLNFNDEKIEKLDFFAGTMFWIAGDVLDKIRLLKLNINDFPEERGQIDGTIAHAVERIFPYLSLVCKKKIHYYDRFDYLSWSRYRNPSLRDIGAFERNQKLKITIFYKSNDSQTSYSIDEWLIKNHDALKKAELFNFEIELIPFFKSDPLGDWKLKDFNGYSFFTFLETNQNISLNYFIFIAAQVRSGYKIFYSDYLIGNNDDLELISRGGVSPELMLQNVARLNIGWFFDFRVFSENSSNILPDDCSLSDYLFFMIKGGRDIFGHIDEPLIILNKLKLHDSKEDFGFEVFTGGDGLGKSMQCNNNLNDNDFKILSPLNKNPNINLVVLVSSIDTLVEHLELVTSKYWAIKSNFSYILMGVYSSDIMSQVMLMMGDLGVFIEFVGDNKLAFSLNKVCLESKSEIIVLLDVGVDIGMLDELNGLIFNLRRPEVGVVSPLVSYENEVANGVYYLGLRGVFGAANIGELKVLENISSKCVTMVHESILAFRKDVFSKVGGFDLAFSNLKFLVADLSVKIYEQGYFNYFYGSIQFGLRYAYKLDRAKLTTHEVQFFYKKWEKYIGNDPNFSKIKSLTGNGNDVEFDSKLSFAFTDILRDPKLIIIPADHYACGYYRVISPFNEMISNSLLSGAKASRNLLPSEIIGGKIGYLVIQRQYTDSQINAIKNLKKYSNPFLVYDLDDYILSIPSSNGAAVPVDIEVRLRKILSEVDRVVVSTNKLAELLGGFNADIKVVENKLPIEWWSFPLRQLQDFSVKPRVGWAGGSSHAGDLQIIGKVVKILAREVDWVFMGMMPEGIGEFVKEFHAGVPIIDYSKKLYSLNLDLALAPLENNLFNHSKSNLRLLEFSACGFNVICSGVGLYGDGRLPVTVVENKLDEWVDAIRFWIKNRFQSFERGRELQRLVNSEWMLDKNSAENWSRIWLGK